MVAQSEKSYSIRAVTDFESKDSSVLFKLLKIYQCSNLNRKGDALILLYSEYFVRSVGGEENFKQWEDEQEKFRALLENYRRHPERRTIK